MSKLLVNKWKTPDGTILHSKHRHDYVSHTDANGCTYAVDGGSDYTRLAGSIEDMENLCLYSDDDHIKLREHIVWGSRGKTGKDLTYIFIKDLDTEHIGAIIETQTHISGELKQVLLNELEYRLD